MVYESPRSRRRTCPREGIVIHIAPGLGHRQFRAVFSCGNPGKWDYCLPSSLLGTESWREDRHAWLASSGEPKRLQDPLPTTSSLPIGAAWRARKANQLGRAALSCFLRRFAIDTPPQRPRSAAPRLKVRSMVLQSRSPSPIPSRHTSVPAEYWTLVGIRAATSQAGMMRWPTSRPRLVTRRQVLELLHALLH